MGRDTVQIRKTDETPPRVSTIAAVIAVTGKSHHHAAQDFRWLLDQYPVKLHKGTLIKHTQEHLPSYIRLETR